MHPLELTILASIFSAAMVTAQSQDCNQVLQDCVLQINSPSARGQCRLSGGYQSHSCTTENHRGYEVHILGIYQPLGGTRGFRQPPSVVGGVQVNIQVAPGSESRPLKLVLLSYEAANWTISVPAGRTIEDIQLYSYYAPYSNVTVLGVSRQPNKILTKRYIGYGKRRLSTLLSTVRSRFGFVTSLTGTYQTSLWNLTVGVSSRCIPTPEGADDLCGVFPNGRYSNSEDCSQFIVCTNGTATHRHCQEGTLWNRVTRQCDHPLNTDCEVDNAPGLTAANQEECLLSETCWMQTPFEYEDNWNDCHGDQYVTKTTYGPYLGVVLCTSTRYKLFMSQQLHETFRNIADGSGHGQDHCELVGSSEDRAVLPSHFWDSPTAFGYFRSQAGESFQYAKIGFGPSDMSQWTGKYYVRWYECGVPIPGSHQVVQGTTSTTTTSTTTTTTTTTTTPTTPTSGRTSPGVGTTPPPGSLILTTKPDNFSEALGAVVVLECIANNPDAVLFWYHNDSWLTGSDTDTPDRVSIHDNGAFIMIDGVTAEDAGEYVCEAETDDDDAVSAAAYGHVELPLCQIDFNHRPTDRSVSAGRNRVILECSARNARRIDWWKKDRRIDTQDGKYRKMHNGFLIIENVCLGDMGEYRCVAHKNDGTCSKTLTMKLDVWQACGQPVLAQPAETPPEESAGHIVGGTSATVGSAPWMAQLFETAAGAFCGGTLIARRWILTAAHCIDEFPESYHRPLLLQHLRIKLGKYDTQRVEHHEGIHTVGRIIMHEDFEVSLYDNDIALLQLENDVEMNDYIMPICLAPEQFLQTAFNGRGLGTVTGWGRLGEAGARPARLQEIQLPMQNRTTCNLSTIKRITDNMFCAGHAMEIVGDACEGDSGGPFIMKHDGKWYQVGIVSWGEGCARPGKYGFYTKLANYYNWIMSKIGENCT